ncbi:MAG: acyl-CoA dehydrogenase family protein, partial [Henriciella sp.]
MNLTFSREEEAFREEIRAFLADKLTPELRRYASRMTSVYSDRETALAWQAILVQQGWAAPSWPVEYGGCDWSV